MITKRYTILVATIAALAVLAGCGVPTHRETHYGPLGIDGDSWFFLILIGIISLSFVLGELISTLGKRARRPKQRDKDQT